MTENLKQCIIATITYYDVFDYPLTSFEVFQYLIDVKKSIGSRSFTDPEQKTLAKVSQCLEELRLCGRITCFRGMYMLPGRDEIVPQRIRRTKESERKMRQLSRIFWWFRFVPFVRMVGITGTLSLKNTTAESDWDVFIVLKDNFIWTGRTVVTLLLQLIGKRRYGEKERDRVCLNHFFIESALEIPLQDLFAAKEYALMQPLIGWDTFQKFQEQNYWIRDWIPNWRPTEEPPLYFTDDTDGSRSWRGRFEWLFAWQFIEQKLGAWQKRKIADNPKTQWEGGYIEATDERLIFLPKPQGPQVFEEYKKRMHKLQK